MHGKQTHEKEVKPPFDGEVTFVCPKCHRPVTWTEVKFTNGSSVNCMDWECKHCGADVLQLSATSRGYEETNGRKVLIEKDSFMKYWVSFKVEGRYITAVDANNAENAIKKAYDEYIDAYFGLLQDIEAEPIIVQDENDNFVWEK